MRIVITGAKGQLGRSLTGALQKQDLVLMSRPAHDVTDLKIIRQIAEARPDVVIHAAALTDVDGCETRPDEALRVNAIGTRNVAAGAHTAGAVLVYLSTDYVFDGTKGAPYIEFDEPRPLSIYGQSKLAGERLVSSLTTRFYIVRSSWLYGHGGANFVTTILRLAETQSSASGGSGGEIKVVHDQRGSPTATDDLAQVISGLILTEAYGLYHAAGEGSCSRYELACEILRIAGSPARVLPATTQEVPRLAPRPANSALRNFCLEQMGVRLPPWQDSLKRFLSKAPGP